MRDLGTRRLAALISPEYRLPPALPLSNMPARDRRRPSEPRGARAAVQVAVACAPDAAWPGVKDFAARFATALAQAERNRFTRAAAEALIERAASKALAKRGQGVQHVPGV
jgi:hypothetical protein